MKNANIGFTEVRDAYNNVRAENSDDRDATDVLALYAEELPDQLELSMVTLGSWGTLTSTSTHSTGGTFSTRHSLPE